MNLFISWSGAVSKAVAEALHGWLPLVIQSIKPWMSAADIAKGARWSADVAKQLEHTYFGIICVTADNLEAPWLLFEAGALSKTLDSSFVCPYLFHLEPADLKGPLVQFQAARADREDTKRLLRSINSAMKEGSLSERQVNESFDVWWPMLETALNRATRVGDAPAVPRRGERELLEEILDLVRNMMRNPSANAGAAGSSPSVSPQELVHSIEKAARVLKAGSLASGPADASLVPLFLEHLPSVLEDRVAKKRSKVAGRNAAKSNASRS